MATKLTDYLIRLSLDPIELTRFEAAPAAVLQDAGLTLDQAAVLRSRDPQRITAALIAENTGVPSLRAAPRASGSSGALTVVGIGIQLGQTALAARAALQQADKVLFVTNDLLGFLWVRQLNPTAESMHDAYQPGKPRITTYFEMSERILASVRQGLHVCAAFYGHPGVFVIPSHEAIRRARLEGFPARMLPTPSAEDCLFADLGLDPGNTGCQSFEATDFLIYRRAFDPSCPLILWQVGLIGDQTQQAQPDPGGLRTLAAALQEHYPPDHETFVYESAFYPVCPPVITRVPLRELGATKVVVRSTLYVPPALDKPADLPMMARLGMDPTLRPRLQQEIEERRRHG